MEKYAEDLKEERGDFGLEASTDASGGETGSENGEGVTDKRSGKGKAGANGYHHVSSRELEIFTTSFGLKSGAAITQARLEREYTVVSVISTLLRGFRVGVIDMRHAHVVLAHYGRLEHSIDTCGRAIIEMLREEGIYNGRGDAVVSIVIQSLKDVRCQLMPRTD